MRKLEDLFLDALADVYYAEQKLEKALPEMAKAATHDGLRAAFEGHLTETRHHAELCEEIFGLFGQKPKAIKCKAILGIIDEAEDLISENKKSPTINAALILGGQKAEHYEIASYGTLREWAKQLQREDAAGLIDQILEQEKAADVKLTRLGQEYCNSAAKSGGDDMRMAA
ncbi:MAG TPA: ferritin-like domain-containing protein [Verrucomicrobiae bacterium]|jgi:ferritin-like metal-binding protein YciE